MKDLNTVVDSFSESIFSSMSRVAMEKKAINLGQGFPDFDGPSWLIELYREALLEGDKGRNQYAPLAGNLSLRKTLSQYYQNQYSLHYDPDQEITITTGCTEAIFTAALSFINPGDEVILFEPFYDSYEAAIRLAGGVPIFITLPFPSFDLPMEQIEKAINSKTKAIFFNSPHNPSGKVFREEEVSFLAATCVKNDLYLLSDEVYEHLIFDNKKHIPIATYPGMKERTFVLSSLGKTFGVTGWKLGWAAAPPKLTLALRRIKQFSTFCTNHPLQIAADHALKRLEDYLPSFHQDYKAKRDLFLKGLAQTDLLISQQSGTYFVLAQIPKSLSFGPPFKDDIDFCFQMIEQAGVAAIPPSAFYKSSDEGKRLVRFCFAKKEKTLENALDHLIKWIPKS